MFRKNTAGQFICFQGVDASSGGIKSGVAWTVRRCIDGTFAAATGVVTEDGTTGWYKYAMSQADTNGNDIGFNFTGTGAVPQTVNIVTTACDPANATTFGIAALPATACTTNASLLTSGTGTDQLSVTSGRIDIGKALGTAITLDANNVINVSVKYVGGTLQTAGDIYSKVSGLTFTGAGKVDASVRDWVGDIIPARNITGVPLVDVKYTLGTLSAGTAGYMALDWAHINAPATVVDLSGTTIKNLDGNTVQTGDAYARLGAPAGASVSADVAAIKSDTGSTLTDVTPLDSGTAQAGAAGSITLRAGASATDNLYRGAIIEITSGTGAGQCRVITGYTGSTKVATVDENWITNPGAASVYRVNGRAPKLDSAQQVTVTQAFPANFPLLGISAGGHISNVDTLTTYTGNTVQTGDAFARLGAPAGASISADIAEIEAETDGIAAIPTNPLLSTDLRLNHLDADISSRLATAGYTAPDNADIAAIKTKTDQLTFTLAAKLDVNILAVNGILVHGSGTALSPWGP